jgi:hypothetical protein
VAETKRRKCGSCGKGITDKNRRNGLNSLCSDCRMPHMLVSNMGDGTALAKVAEVRHTVNPTARWSPIYSVAPRYT